MHTSDKLKRGDRQQQTAILEHVRLWADQMQHVAPSSPAAVQRPIGGSASSVSYAQRDAHSFYHALLDPAIARKSLPRQHALRRFVEARLAPLLMHPPAALCLLKTSRMRHLLGCCPQPGPSLPSPITYSSASILAQAMRDGGVSSQSRQDASSSFSCQVKLVALLLDLTEGIHNAYFSYLWRNLCAIAWVPGMLPLDGQTMEVFGRAVQRAENVDLTLRVVAGEVPEVFAASALPSEWAILDVLQSLDYGAMSAVLAYGAGTVRSLCLPLSPTCQPHHLARLAATLSCLAKLESLTLQQSSGARLLSSQFLTEHPRCLMRLRHVRLDLCDLSHHADSLRALISVLRHHAGNLQHLDLQGLCLATPEAAQRILPDLLPLLYRIKALVLRGPVALPGKLGRQSLALRQALHNLPHYTILDLSLADACRLQEEDLAPREGQAKPG